MGYHDGSCQKLRNYVQIYQSCAEETRLFPDTTYVVNYCIRRHNTYFNFWQSFSSKGMC